MSESAPTMQPQEDLEATSQHAAEVAKEMVAESESKKPEARFNGIPKEVPVRRIEIGIPDSEKSTWKPGVINSNNGLTAAHDKDRPVVYIVESQDAGVLMKEGYEHGSAVVPLTGGDQRGWHKGPKSRELAEMHINAAARRAGVKGREVVQKINGREYTVTVMNPFDDGDFLDMDNVVEVSPDGTETRNSSIVTQAANGELKQSLDKIVGKMCSNNNTLAWVTPEGKLQIAPATEERVSRLRELGYTSGEFFVPHSNGESFKDDKAETTYAEIKFGDMQRKGEKMTLDERHKRFGRVIIASKFMDIIKH